jgi:hypothetical protein
MEATSVYLKQACQRCKAKKVQCDLNEPCGKCTDRGLGHECLRLPRKKRIRHPRRRNRNEVQGSEASGGGGGGRDPSETSPESEIQGKQVGRVQQWREMPAVPTPEYVSTAVDLLQTLPLCESLLRNIFVSPSAFLEVSQCILTLKRPG